MTKFDPNNKTPMTRQEEVVFNREIAKRLGGYSDQELRLMAIAVLRDCNYRESMHVHICNMGPAQNTGEFDFIEAREVNDPRRPPEHTVLGINITPRS